jgi:hypothetical protein
MNDSFAAADLDLIQRCTREAKTLLEGVPATEPSQVLLRAANSLLSGHPDGEAIQAARDLLAHHGR